MASYNLTNVGSGNDVVPSGKMPLPEPMFINHQWGFVAFTPKQSPGKYSPWYNSLHWRHNDHDGVSNHQSHGCLLNRLFRCRSKKTSKLRVTGLSCGEFTGTGEFPAQRASYAENVSIWWRHHGVLKMTSSRLQPFLPGANELRSYLASK